jgi:heptosyltransferase-2
MHSAATELDMKRALLISVQGIGNTVLMTPAITALSDGGYVVDALVSDNGSHDILRLCPKVRRIYVWTERASSFSNLLQLRAELRQEEYDIACALYPNGKRENALLSLCRANRTIRYAEPKHALRLLDFLPATQKLPFELAHDVTNNFRMVQTVSPLASYSPPKLSIPEESAAFAREFFARHELAGKFVIAIQPGGGGTAKRWSETKFAELCSRLATDPLVDFLVCGSKEEADLVERITRAIGNRALAVCDQSIDKVAALLANCQIVVANDSALTHIASALDVPVVVVWGYTDFRRVAPVNDNGVLVRIHYPCNPCYEFTKGYIDDCQYHLKCIKDISVDQMHRIVSSYVSALKQRRTLPLEVFDGDLSAASTERLESGCLKIDLRAA